VSAGRARVLFLGPAESPVLAWLTAQGEDVVQMTDRVSEPEIDGLDLLVSHGYRHLIRTDVLDHFPRRAVNLHISYLPFNRGADPNFWSWVDDTPRGVTIHLVDSGLDTGAIVAQEEVQLGDDHTLRTSYLALQETMLDLFVRSWPLIRDDTFTEWEQEGAGTSHRAAERESVWDRFPDGWDTPVSEVALRVDR